MSRNQAMAREHADLAARADMEDEDLLDCLREACEAAAVPHVMEDPAHESGGFLIGRASARGATLPVVERVIRAQHAIEREARLTFTQETWLDVFSQLDRAEDDQGQSWEIVGWYHSHPSSMIFLSGHDLFIHRNFFSAPHQVAVVIDPHNGEFGTFGWDGDEIELVDGRAG